MKYSTVRATYKLFKKLFLGNLTVSVYRVILLNIRKKSKITLILADYYYYCYQYYYHNVKKD